MMLVFAPRSLSATSHLPHVNRSTSHSDRSISHTRTRSSRVRTRSLVTFVTSRLPSAVSLIVSVSTCRSGLLLRQRAHTPVLLSFRRWAIGPPHEEQTRLGIFS